MSEFKDFDLISRGYTVTSGPLEATEGRFNPVEAAERIKRTARIVTIPNTQRGVLDCVPATEMVRIDCFYRFEVERLIAFLEASSK